MLPVLTTQWTTKNDDPGGDVGARHGDGGKPPTGGDCLFTLALTTMITCVVEKEIGRRDGKWRRRTVLKN